MELLERIKQQEQRAAELRAAAAEQAREILAESERSTAELLKQRAAAFREQRTAALEKARQTAKEEAGRLLQSSGAADETAVAAVSARIPDISHFIAGEVMRL